MTDFSPLFEPLHFGGHTLRNRIVMSPMTRELGEDGYLPDDAVEYYRARAAGGVGLIVTEATTIDHEVAHYSTTEPYMFGKERIAGWKTVVDAVHAEGAAIYPQLWHTGITRKRKKTHNPDVLSIGPTSLSSAELSAGDGESLPASRSGVLPREMTEADIRDVILAFGEAAYQSQQAGFDGIAIHGGHGYIIFQFMWERSNRRTDGYGGSIEARARFANEVVAEIRRRTGPDFPIMFRFSQWSGWDYKAKVAQNPAELERILLPLSDAGVDIFDASTRRFWIPEFEGSDLNLAGWAKKITGKPTMTVGSVTLESPLGESNVVRADTAATRENMDKLMAMLKRGDFDLVGVGRALLANPNWAHIIREGRLGDLRTYDASEFQKKKLGNQP